jgi:hypothetical protein
MALGGRAEPVQPSSQISRPRVKSMIIVPEQTSFGPDRVPGDAFTGSNGGWQTVGGRNRGRPRERRPTPMSRFKELLFRKAKGKCFKCLSPEHRIIHCRNPPKCLLCGEVGHKARWCKAEQGDLGSGAVPPASQASQASSARRPAAAPPIPPCRCSSGGARSSVGGCCWCGVGPGQEGGRHGGSSG